jgi:hypothetical protein
MDGKRARIKLIKINVFRDLFFLQYHSQRERKDEDMLLHRYGQVGAAEQLREARMDAGDCRRRLELLLGWHADVQKHFQRRLGLPHARQSVESD